MSSFPIVGIGASAGGLEAISAFLRQLAPNPGMSFLFVQHLDPEKKSQIGELLSHLANLLVVEATQGVEIEKNTFYVMPQGFNPILKAASIQLQPSQIEGATDRSPIDKMFFSLAREHKEHAIGIVLSGTGEDGSKGAKAILQAGGDMYTQSPDSAQFNGMPLAAIQAGVSHVLTAGELADSFSRFDYEKWRARAPSSQHFDSDANAQADVQASAQADVQASAQADVRADVQAAAQAEAQVEVRADVTAAAQAGVQADAEEGDSPDLEDQFDDQEDSKTLTDQEGTTVSQFALQSICAQVAKAKGVDFTQYKFATVHRRIMRRIQKSGLGSAEEYSHNLASNPTEMNALYEEILIKVSAFFRNTRAHSFLENYLFPEWLQNSDSKSPFRVWVPGCSTGEEPYSIAISFFETLKRLNLTDKDFQIEIFASDVSDIALSTARAGIFSKGIESSMTPQDLNEYFEKTAEGFKISVRVRERCIFAKHDLSRDPPFSNMDFISCQNTLIYFSSAAQERILRTFHFALKPHGRLCLGPAESTVANGELFEELNSEAKIFSRKSFSKSDSPRGLMRMQFQSPSKTFPEIVSVPRAPESQKQSLRSLAERTILTHLAPVAVIIDEQFLIRHVRGDTSHFLQVPAGEPTTNILQMGRPGVYFLLKSAVDQAHQTFLPVSFQTTLLSSENLETELSFTVLPFLEPKLRGKHTVVLCNPLGTNTFEPQLENPEIRSRVSLLERELEETRESLGQLLQNEIISNEQLRSYSEEILSANEELQSASEEISSAKEEVQASNEELTTLNDELIGRNAELNKLNASQELLAVKLREALKDAEKASNAKSDFLANVSHEIRTPLAAIMGHAEILGGSHSSGSEILHAASRIRKNVEHLREIVDEVLDLSKIEAGKFSLERTFFALEVFLVDLFDTLGARARQKGLDFEVEKSKSLPQQIFSCKKSLRQVLSNIIGNAIKFTAAGKIGVFVDATKGQADSSRMMLLVRVSDSGCGISEEYIPRMFSPFEQEDSSLTRRYGGTGLGLVLSQKLAQALGGNVCLVSTEVGRGSVFEIQVDVGDFQELLKSKAAELALEPIETKSTLSESADSATVWFESSNDLLGKNILLVEDGEENRELMCYFLNESGAKVQEAENGLEALQKLQEFEFHAIILDLQMPVMDGHQTIQRIREKGNLTPVIALTGHAMLGYKERCLEEGFSAFLTKPYCPLELVASVKKLIEAS